MYLCGASGNNKNCSQIGKIALFQDFIMFSFTWHDSLAKKNFTLKSPFYYVFTFSVRFWGKFSFLGGQKN